MLKLKESIYEIVDFSFRTLMAFALVLSIFSCFFSHEIMEFRYDLDVIESAPIFLILMICFICVSSTYIYGTLLTANGNLFYLNIIAGIGVILNVVLNFILIQKYDLFGLDSAAMGSAIASLITQFLTGFAQIVLCVYIFQFNLFKTFFQLFCFIVGLVLCASYLSGYWHEKIPYLFPDIHMDLHYKLIIFLGNLVKYTRIEPRSNRSYSYFKPNRISSSSPLDSIDSC